MAKVKLYSHTDNSRGLSTTLPVVGEVKFDQDENSIMVDESKVEELLSRNCGISLSTSKEKPVEVKAPAVVDQKKEDEKFLNSVPTAKLEAIKIFLEQEQHPLAEIFEALKKGRSEEEIDQLDGFIESLNEQDEDERTEERKMLDSLAEKEIDELLIPYTDRVKEFSTKSKKESVIREKKIDFLEKEMLSKKA